jgi:hypothetical protein
MVLSRFMVCRGEEYSRDDLLEVLVPDRASTAFSIAHQIISVSALQKRSISSSVL